MAVSGPQNQGIPGYRLPPKPKPVVGPQNVGLPTYRPGDVNNPFGQLQGVLPAAAPPAPEPAAPPPPPPPPVDYNALINADPGYITQNADNQRQNALAMDRLLKNFRGTAQGYQDQANAHGALFSGAAVNAQRSAAQGYGDQAAQQAANYAQNQNTIHTSAWQRLLNQLAGGA